ncbi:hypothetical protein [Agrobacterium deltaense]|uniref:hypothetical protein n=1 Tax=Agrobacterium deltaense TaxID=1183412 RepID=UPI0009BC402F|nr:hypothetical protein [Agrobacterium deltaense]CUX08646.1 hypothetical protein AGR7B_Cc10174 [Agrobacterium deltaense RV3]
MELEKLSSSDLAAIIAKAGAILAKRAGEQRPAQFALLPDLDPIDPTMVDLDERLPDGSRRWLTPKEVAPRKNVSPDTIIRMIVDENAGIKLRGRYYFDGWFLKVRT